VPIPLLRRGGAKRRGSSVSENALRFQRERRNSPFTVRFGRHCEKRSDEAIYSCVGMRTQVWIAALPAVARNDGMAEFSHSLGGLFVGVLGREFFLFVGGGVGQAEDDADLSLDLIT
jgi:hypothetical protein